MFRETVLQASGREEKVLFLQLKFEKSGEELGSFFSILDQKNVVREIEIRIGPVLTT